MLLDINAFTALLVQELEDRVQHSSIDKRFDTFEITRQEIASKLQHLSAMDIDLDAKASVKKKLESELVQVNEALCEIRCEKVMRYDYDKNLTLLKKKLKKIKALKDNIFGYRDIISCVIAHDRENLLFCIHLSNRALDKIVLENEILNDPIMSGTTPYSQTRLSLNTNWKVIII